MPENIKLVLLPLNSAYASELCRPTANDKFTRTQAKLTRAWALIGPGVDMPLYSISNALETRHMLACVYFKKWTMAHSFLTSR